MSQHVARYRIPFSPYLGLATRARLLTTTQSLPYDTISDSESLHIPNITATLEASTPLCTDLVFSRISGDGSGRAGLLSDHVSSHGVTQTARPAPQRLCLTPSLHCKIEAVDKGIKLKNQVTWFPLVSHHLSSSCPCASTGPIESSLLNYLSKIYRWCSCPPKS